MPEQAGTSLGHSSGALPLPSHVFKPHGALLLACAKCQRKLKGEDTPLAKLRKPLKKLAKARGAKLLVLNVPCLKICPKQAVVVCTQAQVARGEFSLLRAQNEFEALVDAALHKLV